MAKLQDAQAPYLTLTEQASAPATPGAGDQRVYTKTNGKMYRKRADGVEVPVGGLAQQHIHARLSANVSIPADTWTPIAWTIEKNDSWGGLSGDLVTVDETGLYAIYLKLSFFSTSGTLTFAFYDKTAATEVLHTVYSTGSGVAPQISGVAPLTAGSVYDARLHTVGPSTLNSGDTATRCELRVAKLGA